MKILRASAVLIALFSGPAIALFSGPAVAQDGGSPHINMLADGPGKTPEEIEKARAVERAYKDTLKKIPDAVGTTDPWGNIRSEGQAKTSSKNKARTGTHTGRAKNASAKPRVRAASGSTTN